jgi:hypothetical protein
LQDFGLQRLTLVKLPEMENGVISVVRKSGQNFLAMCLLLEYRGCGFALVLFAATANNLSAGK